MAVEASLRGHSESPYGNGTAGLSHASAVEILVVNSLEEDLTTHRSNSKVRSTHAPPTQKAETRNV